MKKKATTLTGKVPLSKVPTGHRERRHTIVMRDKRKRRENARLKKELRNSY